MTPGITLDAGGLIAVDRQIRSVVVLLTRATELGARLTVLAGALAQAIRLPERHVRLARMIRQPNADVALDRVDATNVGRLSAASGTSDVMDAHVVICARRAGQRVLTSDADDLRRLDPELEIVEVWRRTAAHEFTDPRPVGANRTARGWPAGARSLAPGPSGPALVVEMAT